MYDINDCVLVRKTSVFPENGYIETPTHAKAYEFGHSSILGDAINKKLRETITDIDELIEESKKYNIFFETYRRTIHFTINGAVQDSLYGSFDYPYAIIEPLKEHIENPSLKSLRVEDTYFDDDIQISNNGVILAPQDKVDELKEQYDLRGLNIIPYSGSLDEAIKETMKENNYPFFEVNNHGYRKGLDDGTPDSEMFKFINSYAEEHGISQERHFYSSINQEDAMLRAEKGKEIDILHLKYILENGLVSAELTDKITSLLPKEEYHQEELKPLYEELVEEVGLEPLLHLTEEFNQKMIEERNTVIKNKKR